MVAQYNKHLMGCEGSAGLKMPMRAHVYPQAILTRKIGKTDLVFGVRLGFTSRSVQARLQISVCSGYNLCHSG